MFSVSVRAATGLDRQNIEESLGARLATDACVLVFVGSSLVGWGDDYGTFELLGDEENKSAREDAGEKLLAAAVEMWEAVQR